MDAGDEAAALAFAVYVYRIRAGIAAMAAAMSGVDAVGFTGGVGEPSAAVREGAVAGPGVPRRGRQPGPERGGPRRREHLRARAPPPASPWSPPGRTWRSPARWRACSADFGETPRAREAGIRRLITGPALDPLSCAGPITDRLTGGPAVRSLDRVRWQQWMRWVRASPRPVWAQPRDADLRALRGARGGDPRAGAGPGRRAQPGGRDRAGGSRAAGPPARPPRRPASRATRGSVPDRTGRRRFHRRSRPPRWRAPAGYYGNCAAAEAAGAAPLRRGRPGYRPELDRDGDGVACDATPTSPAAAAVTPSSPGPTVPSPTPDPTPTETVTPTPTPSPTAADPSGVA